MMRLIAPGSEPDAVHTSTDSFYRALGLDGEEDRRCLGLVVAVLANLRDTDTSEVPHEDVSRTVLGVMLGLLIAQGTGWQPPIFTTEAT